MDEQQQMYYPTPGTRWRHKEQRDIVIVTTQAFTIDGGLCVVFVGGTGINTVVGEMEFMRQYEPFLVTKEIFT